MDWTVGPPFISLQLDAASTHVCTGRNLGVLVAFALRSSSPEIDRREKTGIAALERASLP